MRSSPQHEPPEALSFGESLSKLQRLSAQTLHETSTRIRSDLSGAEWKMSLCLLASLRENRFRQLGYANITQYAEEALGMSGKKAGGLLAIARLLEHLPLCAAAFRNNEIDGCKLRALQSVLTPETERRWLEYAVCHRTNEVEKKVAMAPKEWKHQGGMAASIAGNPIATEDAVDDIIKRPAEHQVSAESPVLGGSNVRSGPVACERTPLPFEQSGGVVESRDANEQPTFLNGDSGPIASLNASVTRAGRDEVVDVFEASAASNGSTASSFLPFAPRLIRLHVDLTPDQFALYESAESRVRGQAGKKVPRGEVVAKMAEAVLNAGSARSRSRYQILVHTDSALETGWYDTERGPLPVSPEVFDRVKTEKTLPIAPRAAQSEDAPLRSGSAEHGAADKAKTFQAPRKCPGDQAEILPTCQAASECSEALPHLIAAEVEDTAYQGQAAAGSDGVAGSDGAADIGITDFDGIADSDGIASTEGAGCSEDVTSIDGAASSYNRAAGSSNGVAGSDGAADCGAPSVGGTIPIPKAGRVDIPNWMIRAVLVRAGFRCENCGQRRVPLDLHHGHPVSEGGRNEFESLQAYCKSCHSLEHEKDFASKPAWRRARHAAQRSKLASEPRADDG